MNIMRVTTIKPDKNNTAYPTPITLHIPLENAQESSSGKGSQNKILKNSRKSMSFESVDD